jgi:hypothetical protein
MHERHLDWKGIHNALVRPVKRLWQRRREERAAQVAEGVEAA